jgi:protein-disulfide isomerase
VGATGNEPARSAARAACLDAHVEATLTPDAAAPIRDVRVVGALDRRKADEVERCVHGVLSKHSATLMEPRVVIRIAAKWRGEQQPPPDLELYAALGLAHGPARGLESARVTIVAFLGLDDPLSAEAFAALSSILERHPREVRIVIKHFVWTPQGRRAAEAALAAGAQGKHWEMCAALLANRTRQDDADAVEYAQTIGLDVAAFRAELDSGLAERVNDDTDQGYAMGVTGTPTVLINGKRIEGAVPADSYEAEIDTLLE